jgi:hypothetical protein
MTEYVSTNRLRLRMVGGLCGRSGTAANASGYYAITHGLGTPTIFGAVMETHVVTTTAQFTRRCAVRLSGTALVVRTLTNATGVVHVGATSAFRWWAAE